MCDPLSYYWQYSYDAPGQTGIFCSEQFGVPLSDIIFSSVCTSHSVSNSLKFQKLSLRFFMSEARWMAVENVVFFSKRGIVIKLPVIY